eukprot:7500866-Pyramimonas_sp.AAC.1
MMTCVLDPPAAPLLFASDAEGANRTDHGGYGIVGAPITIEESEEVIAAGTKPGHAMSRLGGAVLHLNRADRELRGRIPVSRIPRTMLQIPQEMRHELDAGRWRAPDHIILGEGRAVVRLCQVLSLLPAAHDHAVCNMEDNEPLASAAAKGRSPAPHLHYLLRKISALSVATGIKLYIPWVDTAHQTADELSRKKWRGL